MGTCIRFERCAEFWLVQVQTKMSKRPTGKIKKNSNLPRFDVATLREVAGEKVFARGVAYHEDEQVEIISIDSARVLARVIGSEVYRSQLEGAGKEFSGECSCPAFSDWGFCKHLVATALTANDLAPEAAEQAVNRVAKIRDHLRRKGIEPLVDMIVNLAENDPDLFHSLELATAIETASDDSLFAQFKKAITDATRAHDYIEYHEARGWAEKIKLLLDQIAGLIAGGREELVLRLLDYFFTRMNQALQSMDDSDGEGGAAYAKACKIHLAACSKARPDSVALARELFNRETESEWDFFHGASEAYAEVLGDAGLAEYRRLASEAWQSIKPVRPGGQQLHDEQSSARYRVGAILESFAERDGDIDARIAIRMKHLSSAYDYLGIAQLCLDNKRETEATKWAEEGLWQFEDRPDERLVLFTADLYRRTGRQADAAELLWQTFERLASIELYRILKKTAGPQKAAVYTASNRAIGLLRAKLGQPDAKTRWSAPRELLLQILMAEKLFADAWQVVRNHGGSGTQVLALAKASKQSHPDEALSVYGQEVERLAQLGGQGNYEAAKQLIGQMKSIRENRGQHADHDIFLAGFLSRHKAKRNLMKILQVDAIDRSRRHVG
jgi:uncharacterized Zn finger protein